MRTGKYFRKNEKQIMKDLRFTPTPGSGCGWVHKEDGQSQHAIAQLKSTDADSVRINLLDIKTLENNAAISHKNPVFVVQFLQTQDVYLLIRPTDEILNIIHSPQQITFDIDLKNHEIQNENVRSDTDKHNSYIKKVQEGYETKRIQSENMWKIRRAQGKEKSKRELDIEF